MYFVRYKPLKEKLRSRTFTDGEALPYLVLYFACWTLIGAVSVNYGVYKTLEKLLIALRVTFVMCGIAYTYSQNHDARGFDFFRKFIVLGWVLSVRFAIAIIVVAVLITFVSEISSTWDLRLTHSGLPVVLTALYYFRLGKHVGDTTDA